MTDHEFPVVALGGASPALNSCGMKYALWSTSRTLVFISEKKNEKECTQHIDIPQGP